MEDWHRLAAVVVARRLALGLTQADVKAAGGPAIGTQTRIEQASRSSYKPFAVARLERALRWAPGSVAAILAGGEPTDLTAPPADPVEARLWALVDILGEEKVREDIAYYRQRRAAQRRRRKTG